MVLVVEDHASTREVVAALLRMRGHDVRIAPSGHAALHFLEILRPSAVVLDLAMPDMSGIEILRTIRQHPHLRDVPVLIFSAQEQLLDEARLLGIDAFVTKGRTSWVSFLEQVEAMLQPAARRAAIPLA